MNERITTITKYKDSNSGVVKNTRQLVRIACKNAIDFELIRIARQICVSVNPFSAKEKADAIFKFIRANIQYQNDPVNAELYQEALVTIEEGFGDCDDMVLLGMALNMAVGNIAKAVLLAANNPEYIDHIYYEIETGENDWRSYDPAYEYSYAGWTPDRQYKRVEISCIPYMNTQGFLDDIIEDIFDFFHKFEKHVIRRPIKEIKRFTKENFPIIYEPISDFFRIIRDIKRKIMEELGKILDQLGTSLPIVGAFVKTIVKAAIAIAVSAVFGALVSNLLSIQSPLTGTAFQTITIQPLTIQQATFFRLTTEDNSPLKMSSEEWTTLFSIALSIASFGAATMGSIAAVATLEIAQTAQGTVNVINSIKKKKEVLKQIKEIKAQVLVQRQAQLEIVLKLEHDIEILTAFQEMQDILADELERFRNDLDGELAAFEARLLSERKVRLDAYKADLGRRRQDILSIMKGVSNA